MIVLNIWCLSWHCFLFLQTCALSGESYHLHRKTSVVNYPTIGAAPCILTRNATGLFHRHGPNPASCVSGVFLRVLYVSFLHTQKHTSKWAIPELPFASVSLFHYENEFDMPQNEPVDSLWYRGKRHFGNGLFQLNGKSGGHGSIFRKIVVCYSVQIKLMCFRAR